MSEVDLTSCSRCLMERTSDLLLAASAATGTTATQTSIPVFEERLLRDKELALDETSLFFEDKGAVKATMRKIASRLNDLGIPYVVVGGMALNYHGYIRATVDVDLLV